RCEIPGEKVMLSWRIRFGSLGIEGTACSPGFPLAVVKMARPHFGDRAVESGSDAHVVAGDLAGRVARPHQVIAQVLAAHAGLALQCGAKLRGDGAPAGVPLAHGLGRDSEPAGDSGLPTLETADCGLDGVQAATIKHCFSASQ